MRNIVISSLRFVSVNCERRPTISHLLSVLAAKLLCLWAHQKPRNGCAITLGTKGTIYDINEMLTRYGFMVDLRVVARTDYASHTVNGNQAEVRQIREIKYI